MSDGNADRTTPHVVYCTRCGNAMSVAPQHVHMAVACPHCEQVIEPWRASGAAPPAEPTSPPRHPLPGGYTGTDGYPVSSRNKVIAGLLGICLGAFGAHRFYLGFIGIGILQIVLSCVTLGIAGLWGFVEGILCLSGQMRDVDGLPLRD